MVLELALLLIFPAAMAFAAAMDLFTMTIPNKISLFLIAAFVILAPFVGITLEQFAWHLAAGIAMLVVGIFMFSMGWIGGGDAKIFASAALWFGFEHLLPYVFLASIAGGVLTLGLLFVRKFPLPLFLAKQEWVERLHAPKGGIPYGIALGLAALVIYPSTFWMQPIAG